MAISIVTKLRRIRQSNKRGSIPEQDYTKVVGGWDFPTIKLYNFNATTDSYFCFKTFTLNNFDQESIRVNFIEDHLPDKPLAIGALKRYRKGFWFYCEIKFTALRQLGSNFDSFLIDLHNANGIKIIPHKDKMRYEYWVIVDNGWNYRYWLEKPFLGWKGTLKFKGVYRLKEVFDKKEQPGIERFDTMID